MFSPRLNFYEIKNPPLPGETKSNLDSFLDPTLLEKNFVDKGYLDDNIKTYIDGLLSSVNYRNPFLFGVNQIPKSKFIPEGVFKFKFDLLKPGSDSIKSKTLMSSVRVDQSSKSQTNLLSINPTSSFESSILKNLLRDESHNLLSSKIAELSKRVERVKRHHYTPLIADFDPDEIKLFNDIYNVFNQGLGNTKLINNYFLQMASLFLTGYFADLGNSKTYSGIKGLFTDKSIRIVGYSETPGNNVGLKSDFPLSEKKIQHFKDVLSQEIPWYKNDRFKRDLNIHLVLRYMNSLGSAFRKDSEFDSSVNIAAIATENLVSSVYESLKGVDCKGEDFVTKLKYINENIRDSGLLDPFIGVYTSKNVSPANIRGDMVHVGAFRSSENLAAYTWATEFYIDLAKSLLTGVANKSVQFLEFDHYARLAGLVTGDSNSVAYVPLNSRHFKNYKIDDNS